MMTLLHISRAGLAQDAGQLRWTTFTKLSARTADFRALVADLQPARKSAPRAGGLKL